MAGTATATATARAAPGAPAAARPQVVYVMGSGRSGSTILGIALGNCAGVFYAGELDNWLVRAGAPVLGGTERTRFWSAVREEVVEGEESEGEEAGGEKAGAMKFGGAKFGDAKVGDAKVGGARALFGNEAQLCLERSLAPLRVNRWRARRRLRGEYRRVTEDLYRAIAGVAGATHVVDTSHFPLRARELQALEGIELHLILLVRDPRGVVDSFNLSVGRNDTAERRLRVLSTNANLWLTHLLSVLVFLRHPPARRMVLRHEDFLANPEGILRHILERVGADAEPPDLESLRTGFPLNGNRLIAADSVSLRRRAALPRRGPSLTALLQLPLTAVIARLRPVAQVAPARERAA